MSKRKTFQEFKESAIKRHGERFAYPDGVYIDSYQKIKIHCLRCNDIYMQTPVTHLSTTGCPTCGRKQANANINKGFDSFVLKAILVHGNKYEYVEQYFSKRVIKIPIYCTECDFIFYQKPNCHLSGHGCPSCSKHSVDKNKRGFVYRITCMANAKVYVGITTNSLKVRLRRHFESSKYKASKSPLHDLMCKYGRDQFVIDLLEESNACNLGALEGKWINKLSCKYPMGLNKASPGLGLLIKSNKNQIKHSSIINEIDVLEGLVDKYSNTH